MWFFEKVGNFAPYNQHYEGDAGAFVLAIGVGLLIIAARPAGARVMLVVALIASALHLANHVYASTREGATWASAAPVAVQLGVLGLGAVLMFRAYVMRLAASNPEPDGCLRVHKGLWPVPPTWSQRSTGQSDSPTSRRVAGDGFAIG